MKNNIRHTENGLSLIEIALALIVVGFLTVAFLQIYQIQEAKRLEQAQEYKIFTIKDALNKYFSNEGHYPCPGYRDTSTFDPNFAESSATGANKELCNTNPEGVAPNVCTAADRYCRAQISPAKDVVRIGVIPYKEIGIGREDAIDVYGNQFTYAVSEKQATLGEYQNIADKDLDNPFNDPAIQARIDPAEERAAILVRSVECVDVEGVCMPVDDDVSLDQDILFFSHGALGAGSFDSYGNPNPTTCADSVGTGDSENCDNDAIFVTRDFAVHGIGQTGLPDDELTFTLLDWTYIWDDSSVQASSIYNRAPGNMGVGLLGGETAAQKMHVMRGNIRVESATPTDAINGLDQVGKVQATQYCDPSGSNCIDPAVFGSVKPADPADEDKRLRCDDGFFLAGVLAGAPHCVSVLTDSTKICTTVNGKPAYITNITVNPDTGQLTGTCDTPF